VPGQLAPWQLVVVVVLVSGLLLAIAVEPVASQLDSLLLTAFLSG